VSSATAPGPTIAQALAAAQAQGMQRSDARWLLGHLLGQPGSWLLAHADEALTADTARALQDGAAQAAAGKPLAQLIGTQDFHGLRLQVTADVLVPRPDTETLVDWALALLAAMPEAHPQVADLGTGSGAIALAIKRLHPAAQLLATDLSPAALAVAQRNGQALGLDIAWAEGTWWQAVPTGRRFHLVVSNPPYIAGDDPHLPALRHEPLLALTPGGDGLAALRSIIAGAHHHLLHGAWLLLEHGWDQAEAVAALLRDAGFVAVAHRLDAGQRQRCTGGRWPSPEQVLIDGALA